MSVDDGLRQYSTVWEVERVRRCMNGIVLNSRDNIEAGLLETETEPANSGK